MGILFYILVLISTVIVCITFIIGLCTLGFTDAIQHAIGMILLCALVIALVLVIVDWCFSSFKKTEEYKVVSYNIDSLNLQTTQENNTFGFFILGCGMLNGNSVENIKYYYFAETEKGKKIENVPANKTYIIESDTQEPHLEEVHTKTYFDGWKKVLLGNRHTYDVVTEYILVVPTKTIKVSYDVEL